ncbi:YkvA family protein [Halobacteriaceae archaeon GCM10025711]
MASWRERAERLEAEVYALSLAARDARTPWYAKAVLLLVVAYAVSPVDPIPDFLPVVGYLDELVVVPLGAAVAVRLVPDDVLAACRERADEDAVAGRVRWVGAALVLLGWLLAGALLVDAVTGPGALR